MFDEFLADIRRPVIEPYEWMEKCDLILGTKENITQAIDECMAAEVYGCDIETTGLDNRVFEGRTMDSIVGIGIAPSHDKAYYFPIGHKSGSEYNIPWSIIGREFGRLFDPSTKARPVFHNISFDAPFLEYNGFFSLGKDRWDDHKKWEDSLIIKYLLNPRQKRGRGLKALSDELCDMKMIELDELFPSEEEKRDYSTIDPSWQPCVLYAAADPLCTLRIWDIMRKEYVDAPEHSESIYNLEKMCCIATAWMHRCRVYIDPKRAMESAIEGQRLWWESLLEVYKGASKILERDITPSFVKIMRDGSRGLIEPFDPSAISEGGSATYKVIVQEARRYAQSMFPDPVQKITKSVALLGKSAGTEKVNFPYVYDVLSPQQLGLLLRELGVDGLQASEKSGQVVTKGEVLDEVIEENSEKLPFMKKVKSLRFLLKALSQYLIPFIEDVGPDGTLKPKFDQFSADTGRFSCKTNKKPHIVRDGGCRVPFQGIPAYGKDKDKKPAIISYMRDCISVRKLGWWLVAIDFSGVELRLVTNLSKEPLWIKAFFECSDCGQQYPREMSEDNIPAPTPTYCTNCGSDRIGDLHTVTAVAFYGENAKNLPTWKDLRGNGKGCNFALSYGGTGKAVQRTIGCSPKEGEDKYKTFTSTYKTLASWWSRQHKFAHKHGYVKTAFGRVQPLPDINDDDYRKSSKEERKAVNGPVQGTSADITKLAMSLIYKEVKKRGWFDKLKMILTVHDEIVFEIHEDVIGEAIPILTQIMARNKGIANQGWEVPLLVDVEIGKTWGVPYDLKDLKRGYKEKLVPDGVDEEGKKKYKEERVPVPESLAKIFYVQDSEAASPPDSEEVQREEVTSSEKEQKTYVLDELSQESAFDLGMWLSHNTNGVVMYEGRDITALFT